MKQKFLSVLLATMMLTSLCISGCGNAGKETVDPGSSKESSVSAEKESEVKSGEEKLEDVTIQVWMSGGSKQKDSDKVWAAFNEKLQEYVPNTTVEFTMIPTAEYKDRFSQMLASGEKVDLAYLSDWVTGPIINDVKDGNLTPLSSLLEGYGQGILESLGERIFENQRNAYGDLYYVINWRGLSSRKRGLYIPTELAQLAGDTWLDDTQKAMDKWAGEEYSESNWRAVLDQFDVCFNACKEADRIYSGFGTNTFFGWLYTYNVTEEQICYVGPTWKDNTFTVSDGVRSDSLRVYAEYMADFYKKGYIRSDIASVNHKDSNAVYFVKDGVYDDNTLITYFHTNIVGDLENNERRAGVDLSVLSVEKEPVLGNGEDSTMAVPYCADEPERAMMVLNALFTQPELYRLLIYGIEGEHYTLNDDGTYVWAENCGINADNNYGLPASFIGTSFNTFLGPNDIADKWEKVAEMDRTARTNPLANFIFDTSPVEGVVTALNAIDGQYSEILRKGYMGDKWEETLDQWIAERKMAGVDDLVNEYQKQLDEYVKANNITSW